MLSNLHWAFWQYFLMAGLLSAVIVLCVKYICYTVIILRQLKQNGKTIDDIKQDLDKVSKDNKKKTTKKEK